ncbi:MAG TPA: hypothetical protein DHV14_05645 [Micrococcales bacterium]|uniref:DUF2306 domain-containing protein n=1 Tax=Miniimonas arenae TaxID=676201 RepID=UPI000ED4B992|nr:DUF2306 domain-containing protein [Miniimonas arenae]HCX84613.1 hypothetical protein [Micrococcales bacterium]
MTSPTAGTSGTTTPPPDATPTPTARVRPGLLAVGLLATAVAAWSVSMYATASLAELAADDEGLAATYVDTPPAIQAALYVHIGFAAFALAVGWPQFSTRLRRRSPALHRALGRCYLVAVGVGAVAGAVIAPWSRAELTAVVGFGTLAVLWLTTAWRALVAIRRGDVANHRAWMMRCYALTFAGVTLRLWVGVLVNAQLALAGPGADAAAIFDVAYAPLPFLSWLPNLLVAEWLIRRRGLPSYRIVAQPVAA